MNDPLVPARAIERVCVLRDGRTELVELLVVRAVTLVVDCGCYSRGHTPRYFTLILTYDRARGEGAYVRAVGDAAFRELDISQPVTVQIERVYTPQL